VFRPVAPVVAVLCALGVCAAPAPAATLGVSAPDQAQPQPLYVDATGQADEPSSLQVYGEIGGTSCGATPQDHFTGRTISFGSVSEVPAGPFTVRAQQPGTQRPGVYRMCAYLTRSSGPEVVAAAAATVRYTAPPCPSAAFTLTGVRDVGSGSATVTATVPAAGRLTAAGSGGGSGTGGSAAAGPAALTVTAGQTAGATPVTETFTVTYERPQETECAAPDGSTVTTVRESRTIAVTFGPGGTGGGTPAGGPRWMRAVGGADLLDLYGSRPGVVNRIGPVCDGGCGEPAATMTIRVSAATQKRHRLPSRTIARSGAFKQRGEAVLADLVASRAMIARLRKAKVRKLTTTVTFDARRPVDETVTRTQVFRVGRRSSSVTPKRFCVGTAKDPLCGKDR
jgi:hypothetical protein